METWYRASYCKIEEVNVVKETAEYIFLEHGTRTKKESDWQWFSKDREEAKRMMIERYKKELVNKIEGAKNAISSAKERIKKAEMA